MHAFGLYQTISFTLVWFPDHEFSVALNLNDKPVLCPTARRVGQPSSTLGPVCPNVLSFVQSFSAATTPIDQSKTKFGK
jgi:hypothetical protein